MTLHKEILDDLMKDCPCNDGGCEDEKWCFLKELISHCGLQDRDAEQLRLMYDYKYMQSKKEGADIGRERAFMEFITQYGTKFKEVYREDIKHEELFYLVFGVKKMPSNDEIRNMFK
jgi:hypothetical protein